MEPHSESNPRLRHTLTILLALLGPFLGVATQTWALAVLLLALGATLIVAPPRRSPGAAWNVIFLALLAIACTAFLPARWFAMPEWRQVLTKDFRVDLGTMKSPQPWVSLDSVCMMAGAFAFVLFVATQSWSSHSRKEAARWYVGVVALLAVLAIVAKTMGWQVPFWPKVRNSGTSFGIFPNRNQTANVFALAAIMAVALAADSFRQKKAGGIFWACVVLVLGVGIIETSSRAGVAVFFGGIGLWTLLNFVRRSRRRRSSESETRSRRKGTAITVAALALLLTGFFVFGGRSLDRMQELAEGRRQDFRIVIQKDALHLTAAAPWLGQTVGNFSPVFTMAREASAGQNHTLHPESDWLWVAVEMGWPAVALFALAFALWLRRCLPLESGTDRMLRSAALVCGVMFALHSFADVSAHRPGSAWPAVFLAGLALSPRRAAERNRAAMPAFRTAGVVLVLIGAWWIESIFSERVGRIAPTLGTAALLSERTDKLNRDKEHGAARSAATDALRITPMSADLYFQRGAARVTEASWGAAWDFGTARYLEPHFTNLCYTEGIAWIDAHEPQFAYDAWVEALRRAGKKGPALYERMLAITDKSPALHAMLARLARDSQEYLLVFLAQADRADSEPLIAQLIAADPKLTLFTPEQRQRLFAAWFRSGNHGLLREVLLSNPEWEKEGWRALAALYAESRNFEKACELAHDSLPRPHMPALGGDRPLIELEHAFRNRTDDIALGLQLHTALLAVGRDKEAMETLERLQSLPERPAYLFYVEALMHEEGEHWEQAWRAWAKYIAAALGR